MDSDIEMEVDPRACSSILPLSENPRPKEWSYQELYVFKKDLSTSKPIIYNYSYLKIVLRCQRSLASGKRCSREIDNDCYCQQHYKIYQDGRIDKDQHEFEFYNHELAIAQLQGMGKKVDI